MRRSACSAVGAVLLSVLACAAASPAAKRPPTTVRAAIAGDPTAAYSKLRRAAGSPRVARGELAKPRPGRARRRATLLYFSQLTDFQLADEESPARVEFLDQDDSPLTAAWRPQEALGPWAVDAAVRAVNRFRRSPLRGRRGRRARMRLAVLTGDLADNSQTNELESVRRLIEGGRIDPNSGIDAACPNGSPPTGEAAGYTGVQDPGDYPFAASNSFWAPDRPSGAWAAWPAYPGLLDRAQQPFRAAGLRVPSYVAVGNHDELVQGNAAANQGYAEIAVGCQKPYAPVPLRGVDPSTLPSATGVVPPDPRRALADGPTLRHVFRAGRQRDGHGFAYLKRRQRRASGGAAAYYSFSPRPGVRIVSVDSISEAGRIGVGGNIDDPQFRWLSRTLDRAERRRQLVIVISHEPIDNLTGDVADEENPPCGTPGAGPGCERDPRSSSPVHTTSDVVALLLEHPNVVAWLAGSTHRNHAVPYRRPGGGGFWSLESVSIADWPSQARLLELTDNCDGTLSLFGTLIDTAAPLGAPASGTPASELGRRELAALHRQLSFNDPQVGGGSGAEGGPGDRNVELLLRDPWRGRRERPRCDAGAR